MSKVSCRPSHLNLDRFHQPCLVPGRTSRTSEDCHPRTTWRQLTLAGTRVLPPLRLTGRFCYADWTVCHSHNWVFPHMQVRDPRGSAACSRPALGTHFPGQQESLWIGEFVELQLRNLLSLLYNHRILRKFHRYCRTHRRQPSCNCPHWICVPVVFVISCEKNPRLCCLWNRSLCDAQD